MSRGYIIIFFGLLLSGAVYGQVPHVSAELHPDTIRIGEQSTLTLKILGEKADKIHFPQIKDTLTEAIEVLDISDMDTAYLPEALVIQKKIQIIAFDSGSYNIPSFSFYVDRGNQTDTFITESLSLYVQDIVVDTSQAFKDIKPVVSLPPPPADYSWLWWLLLLLPIAAIIYYWLKRKKQSKPIPAIPVVIEPAHIRALKALQELEKEKVWQKGHYKTYHSRLTEIVRKYIEERFKIPAMEQTSEEIISTFRSSRLAGSENDEKLVQILHLADMVKFAKYIPIASENELSIQNAKVFIHDTIINEETEKK